MCLERSVRVGRAQLLPPGRSSAKRGAAAARAAPKRAKKEPEADGDLLAMFAARRKEREDGFDAFAAKWQTIADEEQRDAEVKARRRAKPKTGNAHTAAKKNNKLKG